MLRQPTATKDRYWVIIMIMNMKTTAHVENQRTPCNNNESMIIQSDRLSVSLLVSVAVPTIQMMTTFI